LWKFRQALSNLMAAFNATIAHCTISLIISFTLLLVEPVLSVLVMVVVGLVHWLV